MDNRVLKLSSSIPIVLSYNGQFYEIKNVAFILNVFIYFFFVMFDSGRCLFFNLHICVF